jgi:hypothetical protein
MYVTKNRCYNERCSRTNYVRSSILHCILVLVLWKQQQQHSYFFLLFRFGNNSLPHIDRIRQTGNVQDKREQRGTCGGNKEQMARVVKKFSAFYGTRRLITAFTSARQPVSKHPHPTSWSFILILSSHLRLGHPSGHFPSPNCLYFSQSCERFSKAAVNKFPVAFHSRNAVSIFTTTQNVLRNWSPRNMNFRKKLTRKHVINVDHLINVCSRDEQSVFVCVMRHRVPHGRGSNR